MKKSFLFLLILISLSGCFNETIEPFNNEISENLIIENSVGIKLSNTFVSDEVLINVKLESTEVITIKIYDISNKVVSKETILAKVGDNILKIHTTTLPSSSYRIAIFNLKNQQLGITDFNKL